MIFIAICYFYNIKAAILTSIANLIPLISLISLSSIFQINFDFSFVLVTVICFGITVDCAIHIINDHYLNHDLKANILKTGAAVTEISLFFIIAFISFLFSDLLIFVKFGILAIIAITISYFVNMVLLPITIRKYLN